MVGFDRGQTLAQRFRAHAGEQTHLYGYVLRGMADDLEAQGPTARVVRGYEEAPAGAVIQLRLLAGIFRLVLTGRAPELRPYYACLGGTESPVTAWPVMRRVIADHPDELHEALAIAPQTNEVGRSVALLVGLFDLAAATGSPAGTAARAGRQRRTEPAARPVPGGRRRLVLGTGSIAGPAARGGAGADRARRAGDRRGRAAATWTRWTPPATRADSG